VFSSRKFGFSTGAIAKGDFQSALLFIRGLGLNVVELSALREQELPRLMEALPTLELSAFDYISIHSPSRLSELSEADAVNLLHGALRKKIPVVVHPDTITDPGRWSDFGPLLLIENLDKRKNTSRTTEELSRVFEQFPDAGFCLDVAHARQVDPTMGEAAQMLRSYGSKLRQIHASGLNSNSTHSLLSAAASFAFSEISHLIPPDVPIILESPVSERAIDNELAFARAAFSPWLQRLQAEIDDIFALGVPYRQKQIVDFLSMLQHTETKLSDFERVLHQLPSGGAYKPGDMFLSSVDLFQRLTETEKSELRNFYCERVNRVATDFPSLREQFKQQFS